MSEEDYRAAAQELLGARKAANAFAATGVDLVSPDAGAFKLGNDASAGGALRLAYAHAVGMGNLEAGQVSIALAGTASSQAIKSRDEREKREKRSFEDRLFQALLDRQRDLQQQMDSAGNELRGIYGDDFIGGMAARYLSEEELAGAQTDDERLAALARVFLDENGEIKTEFADSPEARYVRAWKERQQVEAEIRDYPNMTSEQRAEVHERVSASAPEELFRNEEIENHAQLDEAAEQAVDAREIETREAMTPGGSFGFV